MRRGSGKSPCGGPRWCLGARIIPTQRRRMHRILVGGGACTEASSQVRKWLLAVREAGSHRCYCCYSDSDCCHRVHHRHHPRPPPAPSSPLWKRRHVLSGAGPVRLRIQSRVSAALGKLWLAKAVGGRWVIGGGYRTG